MLLQSSLTPPVQSVKGIDESGVIAIAMSHRERALLNQAESARSGRTPFANVRDPDSLSDSDLEDDDPIFDTESNASDEDRRTIATTSNPGGSINQRADPHPPNITVARRVVSEIARTVDESAGSDEALRHGVREMAERSSEEEIISFLHTIRDGFAERWPQEMAGLLQDTSDTSSDSDFDEIPAAFDDEAEETGAESGGVGAIQQVGEQETNLEELRARASERGASLQHILRYREAAAMLFVGSDSDYSPSDDTDSDDTDSDDFDSDDSDDSFMPDLVPVGSSPLSDETAVAPVAVNEDGVPDDLVCSICMTLPLDPVLTPGDYMFCRPCIEKSLKRSRQCPVTRKACSPGQLKSPEGFVKRLWSSVQVKCGHHGKGCAWTGSVADFSGHLEKCTFARPDETSDRRRLEDLTRQLKAGEMANMEAYIKIKHLEEEIDERDMTIQNMTNQINDVTNQVAELFNQIESIEESHEEQNASLFAELTSARRALSRQSHTQISHSRHFGRDSIVDLSLLVAQNLTRKPRGLDSGRIFNFVRSCYTDLEKDFSDNPDGYRDNVKMLLATCQSCSWFSPRQQENFDKWFQRQFGTSE